MPGLAPPSYDEPEKNDNVHEKTGVKYPHPLEGDEWPKTTGRLKSVEVDEDGLEIIKLLKNGYGCEFFGYLAMIRSESISTFWTSPYIMDHIKHMI